MRLISNHFRKIQSRKLNQRSLNLYQFIKINFLNKIFKNLRKNLLLLLKEEDQPIKKDVESTISNQFYQNEMKKCLIKSQIYGLHYCLKLLETNLTNTNQQTLFSIQNLLLKEDIDFKDINKINNYICNLKNRSLSFESRILLRRLCENLLLPKKDEIMYYDEIESILDQGFGLKLKIYYYFKRKEYSKALILCNQILGNGKTKNFDKFHVLGLKAKILAEMQDFEFADNIVDLALDCYELLSENEKIELQLQNEQIDNYRIKNLENLELDDFLIVKLSSLYIIKSIYLENIGFGIDGLNLILEILPFYSNSKCELSYADLLNEKANKEYLMGNLNDALNDYEKVFNIYLKVNDFQRQKFIFNNLSRIFINLKNWEKAIQFIDQGSNLSITNSNFNEILIISKSLLLYKMDEKIASINLLEQFICNDDLYNSNNADILFYLNIGLIMFLIVNLETQKFNSLNLFKEKMKLLGENKHYIRSEIVELNKFIDQRIISNINRNNILGDINYIKNQFKMYDLPLLIKELL